MDKFIFAIFCCVAILTGCASTPINIAPLPPANYHRLGHVSGDACGSLVFGYPAYAIFPIALNSRVERAKQSAMAKAPGATGLINVQYEESWFWWVLATTRCTTVSGEAIQEVVR